MKRAAALCLIALILHGCTLSQRAVRAAAEPAPTAGTESPAVTAPAPIAAPDAHASQAVDDDLWRKIGRELRLAANEREEVGTAITYFQRNHEVITRAAERSRPYLYYVVTEIERRGLPHELALVPLIESGLPTGCNFAARRRRNLADHVEYRTAFRTGAIALVRRPPRRHRQHYRGTHVLGVAQAALPR